VHLYGRGQSRRGPSFRVPLSALIEANCHPLLNRYIVHHAQEHWTGPCSSGRVDLYVSPPSRADKKHILNFYLSIRNLFAWIYRISLVGEHLGSALITLLHSMQEFRSPDVNNVADIMIYLEGQGYLDMANQPMHALAVVHLAEQFQISDLYIDAFAHCAGMGDGLYALPEYQVCTVPNSRLLASSN
jgi:hypothetical protein